MAVEDILKRGTFGGDVSDITSRGVEGGNLSSAERFRAVTQRRGERFEKSLLKQGDISEGEFLLQTAGHGVGLGIEFGIEAVKEIEEEFPDPFNLREKAGRGISKFTRAGFERLMTVPQFKSGISALSQGVASYMDWREEHPRAAANVEAGLEVGSIIPIRFGFRSAAEVFKNKNLAEIDNRTLKIEPRHTFSENRPTIAESNKIYINSLDGEEKRVVGNVMDTGIKRQVVSFIKNDLSDVDKLATKEMYDIAVKRRENPGIQTLPQEVVGRTILTRTKFILDERKATGKRISNIVKELPSEKIDIRVAQREFLNRIRARGLDVEDGRVVATTNRMVAREDISAYQQMYDFLRPTPDGKVLRTPQQIHANRQAIFKEFDLAKKRQVPFSDDATIDAEKFRSILLQQMDNIDSRYRVESTKFAILSNDLGEFVKLMGYKSKNGLDDLTAKDIRAGEIARRLLGHAKSRPDEVLQNLEQTAIKYGFDPGGSSYMNQIVMAQQLEQIFGVFQSTSLGAVTKGTDRAIDIAQSALDVSVGTGGLATLLRKGAQSVRGKVGADPEQLKQDRINALGDMLTYYTRPQSFRRGEIPQTQLPP